MLVFPIYREINAINKVLFKLTKYELVLKKLFNGREKVAANKSIRFSSQTPQKIIITK